MWSVKFAAATIAAVAFTLVLAESGCNPLNNGTNVCKPNIACPANYFVDFTKETSLPANWTTSNYANVTFGPHGAQFTFRKRGDAPQIWTNCYILFGKVDVVMQVAPGFGMISSSVLMSDDMDEIDWEWSGNDFGQTNINGKVQTNYFGKGVTGSYDRAIFVTVAYPQSQFHTYTVDWDNSTVSWNIDGVNRRKLWASDCKTNDHQYPQTPAKLQIGIWDGGDQDTNQGTVQWAGGYTDLSKAPFTMYLQSVSIQNYSPGAAYNYTDTSGSTQSIQILKDYKAPIDQSTSATSFGTNATIAGTVANKDTCFPGQGTQTTTVKPPGWTATGTTPACFNYHMIENGDTCSTIEAKYGVSDSDFRKWNPSINGDCYNLLTGIAYCVCGDDPAKWMSTSASSAASTSVVSSGTISLTVVAPTASASTSSPSVIATMPVTDSATNAPSTTSSPNRVSSSGSAGGGSSNSPSSSASSTSRVPDKQASISVSVSLTSNPPAASSTSSGNSVSSAILDMCPVGKYQSSTYGCIPNCGGDEHYNPNIGNCCPSGQTFNAFMAMDCVATASSSSSFKTSTTSTKPSSTNPILTKANPFSSPSSSRNPSSSTAKFSSTSSSKTATSTQTLLSCPINDGATIKSSCKDSYKIECSQDPYGGDVRNGLVRTGTMDACIEACSNRDECVGVSWVPGNEGPCYLKKSSEAPSKSAGVWGARRLSDCQRSCDGSWGS